MSYDPFYCCPKYFTYVTYSLLDLVHPTSGDQP